MASLSRVSVSNPTIKPADLLDASRLLSADAMTNVLHGNQSHLADRNTHMDRKMSRNACSQTALIPYQKVVLFFHHFPAVYMDMYFISVAARQMHCLP